MFIEFLALLVYYIAIFTPLFIIAHGLLWLFDHKDKVTNYFSGV